MSKIKITKFGSITENDSGYLHFEDFSIDCEGGCADISTAEIVLTSVVERIQEELAKTRQVDTKTINNKDFKI